MSLKNNLTKTMATLLTIDDKIKDLNKKSKKLKEERNEIESKLTSLLKNHNLENKKFILNNKQLYLNECSTLPVLNIKLVEKILNKYLDKNKTNMIIKDIDEYRNNNKKVVLKIKRKLDKKSLKKKKIY